MEKLIECVPNFSEGRNQIIIKKIIAAIESTPSILILDVESDTNHNRTVISFVGLPSAVVETAFRACKVAAQLIDLNKHLGEHPRMGATDVIPLIPIQNTTLAECVTLSHELGERIGQELSIPVFFYEASALQPDRENLADIRSGEFEGLRAEIGKNILKTPDCGPNHIHQTAGATAIGARMPLIAFNINLDTANVNIAKEIARSIRFKNGGFRYVKALGFALSDRKLSQVSINMTNYQKTPLHLVFDTVKREAARFGIPIVESEIVGLTPAEAVIETAKYYLQLDNFNPKQILETAIKYKGSEKEESLVSFLESLSSKTAIPGGGSVAALQTSLSASLLLMVLRLSIKKNQPFATRKRLLSCSILLEKIRREMLSAVSSDAEAYAQLILSKKKIRNARSDDQTAYATIHKSIVYQTYQVPFSVLLTLGKLLEIVKENLMIVNPNTSSDLFVALCTLEAACQSAYANILVNLSEVSSKDEAKKVKKEASQKRTVIIRDVRKIKKKIKF